MTSDRGFKEILDELQEVEGTEITNEIEKLKQSLYVVNRNFEELNEMDEWLQNQGVTVQLKKDMGDIDGFLQEYLRRHHNYVVAVYTLITNTQRIKRADEYGTNEFDSIYEQGKKKFDIENRWAFLEQLRHYMVHRRLPSMDVTLVEEDEGVRFGVVVSRDELLEHGSFDSTSREYLRGQDEEIDVQTEVHSYQSKVNEFFSWFFETLQSHRDDVMVEREELVYELEEKHEDLFSDLS